jgi:tRNA pseudouridine55 synthase
VNGILLVDKPAGITSHDVVDQVRKELRIKKTGHAGTLDPQATGLLVLALGEATKWLDYLPDDKRYVAGVRFGIETDTQDIWGVETSKRGAEGLAQEKVFEALTRLKDEKLQVPPMVSALKHEGRPLHEWKRMGVEVTKEARPVEVFEVKPLSFEKGEAQFEIHVSSGTYVRSLCALVGERLGCGAAMSSLRRSTVGAFKVEDAQTLLQLKMNGPRLLDAGQALAHMKERVASPEEAKALSHGMDLSIEAGATGDWRISSGDGRLLALARAEEKQGRWLLHPRRVFSAP